MEREMIVPPIPPPAYTMPLAKPRLRRKYWEGVTDIAMKERLLKINFSFDVGWNNVAYLFPIPSMTPQQTNNPGTLFGAKLANTPPRPTSDIPIRHVVRAPMDISNLAFRIANTAIHIGARPPTKLSVEADATCS
jgi:hypothetical protein